MTWQTRASRTVYENRWIRVEENDVVGPHGEGIYGVVEMRHPAVFIIAMDDDDRVCLVSLERYTTGPSWEVPAGGSDGEDPLRAAQRELAEEAGVTARRWTPLGRMDALNGIARAPEFVFLAQDIERGADAEASQHEEGIEAVRWLPFREVLDMIRTGGISDGETVAAIAYAGIHLGRFV